MEPEPKVSNEVQDSPVPSQGDPALNFSESVKPSQAPSEAPPVAAPQDANVLIFGLLKQMTNLVGILTTQLKPNEAAASGSTGAKVVKRLRLRYRHRRPLRGTVTTSALRLCCGRWNISFGQWPWKNIKKVQTAAGLLGGDALTWWAEYIKDQEIVESEMSWTEFKTLVTSRFTPEYANICAEVAWLDWRQTHSCRSGVVGLEANTFVQKWRGWFGGKHIRSKLTWGSSKAL